MSDTADSFEKDFAEMMHKHFVKMDKVHIHLNLSPRQKDLVNMEFLSGIVWACSVLSKNDGGLTPQRFEKVVSDYAKKMGAVKRKL